MVSLFVEQINIFIYQIFFHHTVKFYLSDILDFFGCELSETNFSSNQVAQKAEFFGKHFFILLCSCYSLTKKYMRFASCKIIIISFWNSGNCILIEIQKI